jgi:hypothetical protein
MVEGTDLSLRDTPDLKKNRQRAQKESLPGNPRGKATGGSAVFLKR